LKYVSNRRQIYFFNGLEEK